MASPIEKRTVAQKPAGLSTVGSNRSLFDQLKRACWDKARKIFPHSNLKDRYASVNLPRLIEVTGSIRFLPRILAQEIGHSELIPKNRETYAHLLNAAFNGCEDWETAKFIVKLFSNLVIDLRIYRIDLRENEPDGIKEFYKARTEYKRKNKKINSYWRVYMGIYDNLMPERANILKPKEKLQGEENDALKICKELENMAPHIDGWIISIEKFARIIKPYLYEITVEKKGKVSGESGMDQIGWGTDDLMDPKNKGIENEEINGKTEEEPGKSQTGPDTRRVPDNLRGLLPKNPLKPEDYKRFKELITEGLDLEKETAVILAHRELARRNSAPPPQQISNIGPSPFSIGQKEWRHGDPASEIDLPSLAREVLWIPPYIPKPYYPESERYPGPIEKKKTINLLMVIDSSGSMPDLNIKPSPPVVAGKTVANMALNRGGYVYVINYSERQSFLSTGMFTRDEDIIDRILCKRLAIGGPTTFPVEAYLNGLARAKQFCTRNKGSLQVLIISDSEIEYFISPFVTPDDELDNTAKKLKSLNAGFSLPYFSGALLFINTKEFDALLPIKEIGFKVETVSSWDDLYGLSRKKASELY